MSLIRARLIRTPLVLFLVAPFSGLPSPADAAPWRLPVRGDVVEPVSLGANPFARGRHRGVDLAAHKGEPVRAACPGHVRFAGRAGSFGRAVTVRCGRYVVSYGHLSKVEVRRGERVTVGKRIGRAGTTGRGSSPQPHLHLGVRRAGERHGYVDPMTLLPSRRLPAIGPPPLPPPIKRRPQHRPPPPPSPAPATLPLTAWAGLGLLAAGIPSLTLVANARRRRRRRHAHAARRSPSPTPSARQGRM